MIVVSTLYKRLIKLCIVSKVIITTIKISPSFCASTTSGDNVYSFSLSFPLSLVISAIKDTEEGKGEGITKKTFSKSIIK